MIKTARTQLKNWNGLTPSQVIARLKRTEATLSCARTKETESAAAVLRKCRQWIADQEETEFRMFVWFAMRNRLR